MVLFDDGDELDFPLDELRSGAPSDRPVKRRDTGQGGGLGFNSYPVDWNDSKTSFKVFANGHKFFGCWRKTDYRSCDDPDQVVPGYAVDIWCQFMEASGKLAHEYAVRTIFYRADSDENDGDPRSAMRSLNGDICAAINFFLYRKLSGDMGTLEELRQMAKQPIVHIDSIETMDRFILKLRETRDTAIRSGGTRMIAVPSDQSGDPHCGIQVTFNEAYALKGKVPPINTGAVLRDPGNVVQADGTPTKTKRKPASGLTKETATDEHILELCQQLEGAPDATTKRKLRAELRRLGHKGGIRALREKLSNS